MLLTSPRPLGSAWRRRTSPESAAAAPCLCNRAIGSQQGRPLTACESARVATTQALSRRSPRRNLSPPLSRSKVAHTPSCTIRLHVLPSPPCKSFPRVFLSTSSRLVCCKQASRRLALNAFLLHRGLSGCPAEKKKKKYISKQRKKIKKKIIFRVHFCIELYIHIHTYIYIHSICSSPFPVSLFEVVGEFETAARSKRKKSGNIYLEGPLPASF